MNLDCFGLGHGRAGKKLEYPLMPAEGFGGSAFSEPTEGDRYTPFVALRIGEPGGESGQAEALRIQSDEQGTILEATKE